MSEVKHNEDWYLAKDINNHPLKYDNLSSLEKKAICNGCGAKGGYFKAPSKLFVTASCNHHDFNYWKGTEEPDRLKADLAFYLAMRKDVAALPWYRKPLGIVVARSFYQAVKLFGKKDFHYSDRNRTWMDVFQEVQSLTD